MIDVKVTQTIDENALRLFVNAEPVGVDNPPAKHPHARRERHVGDGGEIRIGGLPAATTRTLNRTRQGRQLVTYAKLLTQAQANRANQIQDQLFGPGT